MSIEGIEDTVAPRRRGRPKKVRPPAPEPAPVAASSASALIASARRVIGAMAKRLGATPSAAAACTAAAQMRRTADFLDAIAAKDLEAFMAETAPVAPPQMSTLETEVDDEPIAAPAAKKRSRGMARPKSEDVVCEACGTYGHSEAYCPERA